MMKCRSIVHLLFVFLLFAGLASTGCGKRVITRGESDRLESLAAKIAQAEAAGARECAPRELAQAKVALDHARHEATERYEDFMEAVAEAEKAVDALLEKMKGCKQTAPTEPAPGKTGKDAPVASGKPETQTGTPTTSSSDKPDDMKSATKPTDAGLAVQPVPPRPEPVPALQKDEGSFENIYFDFDESVIREDAKPILLKIASYLKQNAKWKLLIEGHCDERGTSEYNMALGQRRADATRNYLVNLGIPTSRLTTVSFGKERPLIPGHDEAAWSMNRRSVFVLTP